jgi:hypothetical protein
MPKRTFATAFAIVSAGFAAPAGAHATCQVEGVWEQVSLVWDGRVMPAHSRPLRKIVYHGHWMEIGTEANRSKLPQQTELEKLRATQTFGGAGTYTTTDRTFTQHIDYFSFPGAEGATLTGPCRTKGKFWRYSFSTVGVPGMEHAAKHVTEVFRRLQ